MKTKGFTLVELLVVIAILAILATVSVVGYTSFIDRANLSNAETEAHQVESAIEATLMIPGEVYEIGDGKYVAEVDDTYVVATWDATNKKYVKAAAGDITAAFEANADFTELVATNETNVFYWTGTVLYYIPGGMTTYSDPAAANSDTVYAEINFND